MALTLAKTWESISLGPYRGVTAPTIGDTWAMAFIGVKNAMVATGHWSVVASSNRVSVGLLTDYIQVPADIYCAAAGTAHSWIVLKNAAIAPDFSVCFEWINATATNKQYMCTYVTHQGYNSNGTLTTRPTAVGSEQTITTNLDVFNATTSALSAILLISSDGECTRVLWQNPDGVATGHCGPWMFERLRDPVPWLTVPYLVILYPTSTTGTVWNFLSSDGVGRTPGSSDWTYYNSGQCVGRCYHTAAIPVTMALSCLRNTFADRADYTGKLLLEPVCPYSLHATIKGVVGQLYDIYFHPYQFRWRAGNNSQSVITAFYYLPSPTLELGWFAYGDFLWGGDGTIKVFNG
jgi:hypothetical protein